MGTLALYDGYTNSVMKLVYWHFSTKWTHKDCDEMGTALAVFDEMGIERLVKWV